MYRFVDCAYLRRSFDQPRTIFQPLTRDMKCFVYSFRFTNIFVEYAMFTWSSFRFHTLFIKCIIEWQCASYLSNNGEWFFHRGIFSLYVLVCILYTYYKNPYFTAGRSGPQERKGVSHNSVIPYSRIVSSNSNMIIRYSTKKQLYKNLCTQSSWYDGEERQNGNGSFLWNAKQLGN